MTGPIELLEGSKQKNIRSTLDALHDLRATLPEYLAKPSTGMHYSEQIKYVAWKFSKEDFKQLEILHLTDVQFGHVECRVHKFIEYRDWVLSKPNRFVLFGGDMVDAATVLSPGEPWENMFSPQRQVYKFCELVAPLRARILGYVGGNHERRGIKTFGDLGVLIASLLGVPYSGGQQLIDIHFGDHKPFPIHLWHGGGSAQTKGAKAQMLHRFMMTHPGARLYLVGHLHDCLVLPGVVEKRMPGNKIHMEKIFGGMSSSFLSYWGTYAEVAGMYPSDVLMLRTVLDSDGRAEVTIR